MVTLNIEKTRKLMDFDIAKYTITDCNGLLIEEVERSYTDKAIINIVNRLIDKYGKVKLFKDQLREAQRILPKTTIREK